MSRAETVPERTDGQRPDQTTGGVRAPGRSSDSGEPSRSGERPASAGTTASRESLKEKLDRELVELLQEMRVMLPGIEVVFGFLLTVPFTERFTRLSDLQRFTYFTVFITTALAIAFLVAPSAYHRLRWRQYDKEHLLQVANKFAITGLAFFAVSLAGIAFIVTDVVIRTNIAMWVAAAIGLITVTLWFGLPLFRRAQAEDPAEPSRQPASGRRQ